MKFKSRKDVWLGVIIWLSILLPFAALIKDRLRYGLLGLVPYLSGNIANNGREFFGVR